MPNKCPTTMTSGYRPKLNATAELDAEGGRLYQELIGVLRWAVELERIDIMLEVSMFSTYLALTRT